MTEDWVEQAAEVFANEGEISVALMQRRLRMGYSAALDVMQALESLGVVVLTRQGWKLAKQDKDTNMSKAQKWMLEKFSGCDFGDPGSPERPSIWLFGIEHGIAAKKFDAQTTEALVGPRYSVELQRTYRFNTNTFKLLAAMSGRPVSQYIDFANEHQPFVEGCTESPRVS